MLEKPNIPDDLIVSSIKKEYGLEIAALTFLPLGADTGTVVYRAVADNGTPYFLKLRKGFSEIVVAVPLFLYSQGIQEIIVPFETRTKQHWADFGEYKIILYPFIAGENGFETELSHEHKRRLGNALRQIHAAQLPPDLQRIIPRETFSPQFREGMRSIQAKVEEQSFQDPVAANLATFIKSRRDEIDRLIERTEELAHRVQTQSLECVLCHTDIHGGNILICSRPQSAKRPDEGAAPTNLLYIVDWDAPLLAPKERDLMFIGGGIDNIWKSKRDEEVFYEGYGNTSIDRVVLAYYRYERVIEDLVAYGEQLLFTDEGGADRESAYEYFTGNFQPGQTIEIAQNTDPQSNENYSRPLA